MLHIARFLEKNNLVSRNFGIGKTSLTANSGKNGSQGMVVRLTPTLGRVMVALSALDTHSQKCLRTFTNMALLSMGLILDILILGAFWATLGPFWASQGPG